MVGDWKKAGVFLKRISAGIYPFAEAQLMADGKLVLERMLEHIADQDLNWTPLSDDTIRLKEGNEQVYVDTGYLRDNLSVRRIKSTLRGSTIFIGASPWKTHQPSGLKFSDLMIYLEYGTATAPPRPLVRPTWEEVRPMIEENWEQLIKDFIRE